MRALAPGGDSGGGGVVGVPSRVEVAHDDGGSIGSLKVVEYAMLCGVLGIGEGIGVVASCLVEPGFGLAPK